MKKLVLIAAVLLAGSANAQHRLRDQRLIGRAVSAIQQAPVPSQSVGVAYNREVRLSVIPIFPPFGAFAKIGRGVVFDRDCYGQLSNPKFVRSAGIGGVASMGMGIPYSIGTAQTVRAFDTTQQARDFAARRWVGGDVQAFAAVGVPGKLLIKSAGPRVDRRPGTEIWRKDRFAGLFASVGVTAGIDVQWRRR